MRLAGPDTKCRSCPHPAHLGSCFARSGGTGYRCGCVAVTVLDNCARCGAAIGTNGSVLPVCGPCRVDGATKEGR